MQLLWKSDLFPLQLKNLIGLWAAYFYSSVHSILPVVYKWVVFSIRDSWTIHYIYYLSFVPGPADEYLAFDLILMKLLRSSKTITFIGEWSVFCVSPWFPKTLARVWIHATGRTAQSKCCPGIQLEPPSTVSNIKKKIQKEREKVDYGIFRREQTTKSGKMYVNKKIVNTAVNDRDYRPERFQCSVNTWMYSDCVRYFFHFLK